MTEYRPDYDRLWKVVITELFEEFLLFFAPNLSEQIDFSSPPEFLEQELQTINPDSGSPMRVADKLVKLQLKNGTEQWVYIHVEVQGGYKKEFPERMFQTFYRIMDHYQQKVYALALFTDEDSIYNKDHFQYEFYGTELTYQFNTYQIASQSETTLLHSQNPFALAVLAGLYLIKSKKDINLKFQYKRKLMRLLLQDRMKGNDIKREYIQKLLVFIDHIIKLPEKEEVVLVQELYKMVGKEELIVALSFEDTSFARYYRNEAKAEGRAEGKAEGKAEGEKQKAVEIAIRLLQKGNSIIEVTELTDLPAEEVKKLKESL